MAFVTAAPLSLNRRPAGLALGAASSPALTGGYPVCPVPSSVAVARPAAAKWSMARVAKFGPFTPLLQLTRLIIGDKPLNKLRGKGIALHSQAITAFCDFSGTGPKMRQSLIRVAKENGSKLGFLS